MNSICEELFHYSFHITEVVLVYRFSSYYVRIITVICMVAFSLILVVLALILLKQLTWELPSSNDIVLLICSPFITCDQTVCSKMLVCLKFNYATVEMVKH